MSKNVFFVSYFSEKGPSRQENQDNLFVHGCLNLMSRDSVDGRLRLEAEEGHILAVFDGMGGGVDGAKVSRMAAEEITSVRFQNTTEILQTALEKYYRLFLYSMEKEGYRADTLCGTTCAALALFKNRAVPFWMGDSRVYLLRQGNLRQLTRDHSVGQQRVDNGLFTEEEARSSSLWHCLTQYMGSEESTFSLGEVLELRPGDRFLLCSDGLSDEYTQEEIQQILSLSREKALETFRQRAITQATDNSTAILADYQAAECEIQEKSRRFLGWFHQS